MTDAAVIRPLKEGELAEADHIFRLAFGTFIGLPDPMKFAAGCDFIRHRWNAAPDWTFGAEVDGRLAGTNLATRWGSVAFFGPLAVRPELWGQRVASHLLESTMDLFAQWGTKSAGLFTFPHSAKHAGLYQKFGFWPRFLTAIMAKPVASTVPTPDASAYSRLSTADQRAALDACRDLADEIHAGLDLTHEIQAVDQDKLGDTILVWEDSNLAAFAICHCGAGTEAGPDTCYVKFGAVRPDARASTNFGRLLGACESLARERGLPGLLAGVNLASHEAYREMLRRGFHTEIQGIAMHRGNDPVYCRPEIFALGDWR